MELCVLSVVVAFSLLASCQFCIEDAPRWMTNYDAQRMEFI